MEASSEWRRVSVSTDGRPQQVPGIPCDRQPAVSRLWHSTAAVRCNTEVTDRCQTTIQNSICTQELRSTNNKSYLTKDSHLNMHNMTSNKFPSRHHLLTNEREKKGIPEG